MYNIFSGIRSRTNHEKYDTINNILWIANYHIIEDYRE